MPIALRNGVIAITERPNDGLILDLGKNHWSQLIIGEITFASLHTALKVFDQAIER